MRFDCPACWHDFQNEASVLAIQQPYSHLERPQLEEALRQEVGKLKRCYSTLSKKPASISFIRIPVGTQPRVGNTGVLAAGDQQNQAFLTDTNKACGLHWDKFLKVFASPSTGMVTL
ncbi:hypothetical protein [Coleofasciculus sp. FACHB-1120]|uniref:hypothetical protein n=1 Tax=Coleofasciculus sp. FACHB-1120 TaxID=2692783 RepID=UPI00168771EC|nr:hypothetical protein [Coleofasciculus sp. FACHB-1120]MBD2742859.1 hypothetical protein [Coleofasciculus sp. FACHB-1120]